MNKAQAVMKLESIKDIYSTMKGSGFIKNGTPYSLCGILFFKEWGYYTNNHFLVRVHVPDRADNKPVFYNYDEDSSNIEECDDKLVRVGDADDNSLQNLIFYNYENSRYIDMFMDKDWDNYIKNMNNKFDSFNPSSISIDHKYILGLLDDVYGKKVNEKKVNAIKFIMNDGKLTLLIYKITLKETKLRTALSIEDDRYSISSNKLSSDDDNSFCINAMYLYSMLKLFEEEESVSISFHESSPVLIQSRNNKFVDVVLAQCFPRPVE